MELREFTKQALVDIVGTVEDAQKSTPSGTVVPADVVQNFRAVDSGVSQLQAIEFEVTVRVDDRRGSEAKLSVVAAVVGGGIKGESSRSGGHVATLRFRIPIRLPTSLKQQNAP